MAFLSIRVGLISVCGSFLIFSAGLVSIATASPGGVQDGDAVSAQSTPDTSTDGAPEEFEFQNELFDAPIRLMVGDQFLNMSVRQMYPSPAIVDIDGDGAVELVVGDIFGSLYVYENQSNSAHSDPSWGKPNRLKSADGKNIKVSNW